jgi:hypothetical protein
VKGALSEAALLWALGVTLRLSSFLLEKLPDEMKSEQEDPSQDLPEGSFRIYVNGSVWKLESHTHISQMPLVAQLALTLLEQHSNPVENGSFRKSNRRLDA